MKNVSRWDNCLHASRMCESLRSARTARNKQENSRFWCLIMRLQGKQKRAPRFGAPNGKGTEIVGRIESAPCSPLLLGLGRLDRHGRHRLGGRNRLGHGRRADRLELAGFHGHAVRDAPGERVDIPTLRCAPKLETHGRRVLVSADVCRCRAVPTGRRAKLVGVVGVQFRGNLVHRRAKREVERRTLFVLFHFFRSFRAAPLRHPKYPFSLSGRKRKKDRRGRDCELSAPTGCPLFFGQAWQASPVFRSGLLARAPCVGGKRNMSDSNLFSRRAAEYRILASKAFGFIVRDATLATDKVPDRETMPTLGIQALVPRSARPYYHARIRCVS